MLKPTFSKTKPTRPGYYLCWRKDYLPKPEVVQIRRDGKRLIYIGHISIFPLSTLKDETYLFSEAIDLKGE